MTTRRQPVHRSADNELVGFVEPAHGSGPWRALTVFGGHIADAGDRDAAVGVVLDRGLASLTEQWWFYEHELRQWRRVQLSEVHTETVRGHNGPYPQWADKLTIRGADLASMTLTLPPSQPGDAAPDYGDWPE
ncbi:hypothetical protein [Antrihabitans sp. YC2-6]|uniref:hypothetical protein n=1 Tax=Antrihabitans sp. YC2-6 TaxID=2799498 RepID=UPI0018F5BE1F|nr:hypothetical protein [Antrihabitans sp. YC2-6]MBJ8344140.1 hypothetical protein [Antrihabitans sp. YC2-6]